MDVDSGHASLAVVARQRDAVHGRLADAGVPAQDLGDLGRAHVLALPAESVAEPVEEEPAAVGVAAERVARAVVAVALPEDVVHVLLGRGLLVPVVPRERGRDGRRLADEDLAADVVGHARGEARLAVAHDVPRVRVDGDGHQDAVEPPAADEPVVADAVGAEVAARRVVEGQDALGRVEELVDGLDAEALAEGDPDVGAQAVAVDGAHVVLPVEGRGGRREEVPQRLADVDEPRGPRGAGVVPEARGAELGREAERAPRHELRHAADAAGPVVERHAVVVALRPPEARVVARRRHVGEAAVPAHAVHEPRHGRHDARLGEARRAARVEKPEGRLGREAGAQVVGGARGGRDLDLRAHVG